jgi:enoyl-CoA hydratase
MLGTSHVQIERLERILRITVNRPEALNAVNSETLSELIAAFSSAASDVNIRAVIITGAGEEAFMGGASIKEMSWKSTQAARRFAREGHRLTRLIEEIEKPVIAAINGVALGGGFELALACDIRIAGDGVRMGAPDISLGICPGWGGTIRLARIVGEGFARELIFSGRLISADEALRIGLVNRVVPHNQVSREAYQLADLLASQAPIAVAYAKRCMNSARSADMDALSELESGLFALCFSTDDQREGMAAFTEKRPPNFRGR